MIARRQFITLLGGAAAAWPLAARAQQPDRMRRVGVLLPATAGNSEYPGLVQAFLTELKQLGWTNNVNIAIDIPLGRRGSRRPPKECGRTGRACT